jgi:hypothetical protein
MGIAMTQQQGYLIGHANGADLRTPFCRYLRLSNSRHSRLRDCRLHWRAAAEVTSAVCSSIWITYARTFPPGAASRDGMDKMLTVMAPDGRVLSPLQPGSDRDL